MLDVVVMSTMQMVHEQIVHNRLSEEHYLALQSSLSRSVDDLGRIDSLSVLQQIISSSSINYPFSSAFIADFLLQKLYQHQLSVFDCIDSTTHAKFEDQLKLLEIYLQSLLYVLEVSQQKPFESWQYFFGTLQSLIQSTFQSTKLLIGTRISLLCRILVKYILNTREIDDDSASNVVHILELLLEYSMAIGHCPEAMIHTPFFDDSVRMVLMQQALREQQQAERMQRYFSGRQQPPSGRQTFPRQQTSATYWNETVMGQYQAVQDFNGKRRLVVPSYPKGTFMTLTLFHQWNLTHRSTQQQVPLSVLRFLCSPSNMSGSVNTSSMPSSISENGISRICKTILHVNRWKLWTDNNTHLFQAIVSSSKPTSFAVINDKYKSNTYKLIFLWVLVCIHQDASNGIPNSTQIPKLLFDLVKYNLSFVVDSEKNAIYRRKYRLCAFEAAIFLLSHAVSPLKSKTTLAAVVEETWQIGWQLLTTTSSQVLQKAKDRWRVQNAMVYLMCHRGYLFCSRDAIITKIPFISHVYDVLIEWVTNHAMVPILRVYATFFIIPALQSLINTYNASASHCVESASEERSAGDQLGGDHSSCSINRDDHHQLNGNNITDAHSSDIFATLLPNLLTNQELETMQSLPSSIQEEGHNASKTNQTFKRTGVFPCPSALEMLFGDDVWKHTSIKTLLSPKASSISPIIEWPAATAASSATMTEDSKAAAQPWPNMHCWTQQDMIAIYQQGVTALTQTTTNNNNGLYSSNCKTKDYLSFLPEELLVQICLYLSFRRVIRLCRVNRSLHKSIRDNNPLWQELYWRSFPQALFLSELSISSTDANNVVIQSSVSSSYESTTGEAVEDCPTCLLASLSLGQQKLRPCKYRDERHMWLLRFKNRVQQLKSTKRQGRKFRACPVIGCDAIVQKGDLEKELQKHLLTHVKKSKR